MFLHSITKWLHTMYPMGTVEKSPTVEPDGSTNVPGVYVAGDLAGIPLLKFSQHTGARVAKAIIAELNTDQPSSDETLDVAILGAGVAGISAALECERAGLKYEVLEASEAFSTIANFPKKKPIYLYPTEMQPDGELKVTGDVKESLLEELQQQARDANLKIRTGVRATHIERRGGVLHVMLPDSDAIKARRVIIAIGRSGNFRRMNVPGEDLDKVSNRLYDPAEFTGQNVLIVGGGDSAAEAAIALADAGAHVTMSYRGTELNRPKPENVDQVTERVNAGKIDLLLNSVPREITSTHATIALKNKDETIELENDVVFALIGREAPLEFFRRSGIPIQGEWNPKRLLGFASFLIFCVWLYSWKGGGFFSEFFRLRDWFPFNMPGVFEGFSAAANDPSTLIGTLKISMSAPSFYYTIVYSFIVLLFGLKRIKRRKTPYVKVQTWTLIVIQILPLFLLPEIILPYLGHNGAFDHGLMKTIADNLFPAVDYGQGREYWRSFGFILAWPLFLYNFFTPSPMGWWLAIGCIQTFVLIPGMIYFFGKGAYCGWICSCGALAETLGDSHRQKMPHGPFWSKLNMAGQIILWLACGLMLLRIGGWIWPDSFAGDVFNILFEGKHYAADGSLVKNPANYKWIVDVSLSGIVGVGFYFWYSGRVWCRFFCPLAALMHIFAKFSKFRIIPEKKKCISCNVCTSVCHQGIDIMNFANKGIPMEDPECVRCSACVQMCPTGVLQFGTVDKEGNVEKYDSLAASPVLMAEKKSAPK